MDIKRYEAKDKWSTNGYYYPVFSECEDGEWVQYSEAKGIIEENQKLKETLDYPGDIPLMIQRAIAKERENCALILEDTKAHNFTLAQLISKIRARGEE